MDLIKVLIAEDQEILRTGLKLTINTFDGIEVVGEAANGRQCIELSRELEPDVILMDLVMPELNGIDATHRIKQAQPAVRVIVFTSYSRDEDIFAAFGAGADAYCLKDIDPEKLGLAIRTAATGALYMDPRVAQRIFSAVTTNQTGGRTQPVALNRNRAEALSTREVEVLKLLVEGLSNGEIATRLTISSETAKSHVRNIMSKMQVSDRTQAAVKAIREGLIPPDS